MIFDIKKYAVDDGPGVRTTVFFKGCPLRCWWCHNPEGQQCQPQLMYRRNRCIGCGACVPSCSRSAISQADDKISIRRELCDLCGNCVKECPTEALSITGKEASLHEVVKEISKDMIFYDESAGGVTFSGGEPLMQIDFLSQLLRECRNRDICTAVDTSGHAKPEAFRKISDKVDLFLYDIKILDDKKHKRYTGMSNRLILHNLRKLAESGHNILARLPVVPGINDRKGNLVETAHLLLSHNVRNVCLLPYHRAGIEKYRSLDRPYKLNSTQAPSDQSLSSIKERLETLGLRVKIGGG